jgi:hypothetical protein
MLKASCVVALMTLLPSCLATVGVKDVELPQDAAQTCSKHCETIGMRLSAVAIMADNVGCVCQFATQPPAGPKTAGEFATPTAGMATIAVQQAAAEQERQRQAQQ